MTSEPEFALADESLMSLPAYVLAERIRSRFVSPVEAVDAALSRIDRLNPNYNAYLTVCHDEARAAAKAAEGAVTSGADIGPLHGLPISIKDLLYTKGIRSTGGSLAYAEFTPEFDAPLVARLRTAGAIIIGKTNTPEFGVIPTTENRLGDPCRNPWNPARTTGGSSGGAAASSALGLGSMHVGTDGGGSIRIPASLCGVFGIKPTLGRVPPYTKEWGGYGGWPTLSQAGPIARNVKDAGLMLDVISGPEPGDPFAIPPADGSFVPGNVDNLGLKIAWSPDLGWAAVDPEVREICAKAALAFQDLGCEVDEAHPDVEGSSIIGTFGPLAAGADAAAHDGLLEEHGDQLTDYAKRFLEFGAKVTASQYVLAEQRRVAIWRAFDEFLSRYDLLLTPTLATAAFPIGEQPSTIDGQETTGNSWSPFTAIFNLTGQPAASMPCGWTAAGLPVGLHIIARAFRERTILRAAQAYSQAHPWDHRWPPDADEDTKA